jgi:hypothetical protein
MEPDSAGECAACGAAAGAECDPTCIGAFATGAPREHEHLAEAEADLAQPCPVCGAGPGTECAPGANCGWIWLTGRPAQP